MCCNFDLGQSYSIQPILYEVFGAIHLCNSCFLNNSCYKFNLTALIDMTPAAPCQEDFAGEIFDLSSASLG